MSEAAPLQYRFALTREEYLRTAARTPRWWPVHLVPVAIALATTLAIAVGMQTAGAPPSAVLGILTVMSGASVVFLVLANLMPRILRVDFADKSATPAECTVTIDESGIRWAVQTHELVIGWSVVRGVRVGQEFATLVLRDYADLSIPLRAVPDREALLACLRAHGRRVMPEE